MATTTRRRRSTDTRNDHPHADEGMISSKWLCGPTQTEQDRTHDTNKAHQPRRPPRTRRPPEPMHRYGINYLGTLLSSQRTDAHPPLTLAGSVAGGFPSSNLPEVLVRVHRLLTRRSAPELYPRSGAALATPSRGSLHDRADAEASACRAWGSSPAGPAIEVNPRCPFLPAGRLGEHYADVSSSVKRAAGQAPRTPRTPVTCAFAPIVPG
jgi:hypothetical protein